MDLIIFKQSLHAASPPLGASAYAQALWHEAKGDWEKAHVLVQDLPDKKAAWIHAYLHRKEGDTWNADYWYSKAGKKKTTAVAGRRMGKYSRCHAGGSIKAKAEV